MAISCSKVQNDITVRAFETAFLIYEILKYKVYKTYTGVEKALA